MRIGHGYDVHKFAENRKLIIGGEEIPFEVVAWQPLPQPYQPKGE